MGRHGPEKYLGLTREREISTPQVEITVVRDVLPEERDGLMAFGVYEDTLIQYTAGHLNDAKFANLDESLLSMLGDVVSEEFRGGLGESAVLRLQGLKGMRVAFIGLGSESSASPQAWRVFAATAVGIARPIQMLRIALTIICADVMDTPRQLAAVEALASASVEANFSDTRFKSKAPESALKRITIHGLGCGGDREEAVVRGRAIAEGVIFTKKLVAAPANVLTPGDLADSVESLVHDFPDVFSVKILEREACEALGMGSFLSVSEASDLPPKFIHLTYTPPGSTIHKKLAIIGKGLTFDSGGYNIKTGAGCNVEYMKYDMAGAGATFGAARALGAIKPKGVEVHFISAACENMISGRGMRPGDVVTASNGKTIEVNNTDAEGRLTLADALVYACRLKVDQIVDLATLTGAIIVALGDDVAGFFTPHDDLAKDLDNAAEVAGELLWRMPLVNSYKKHLLSPIADLVNTGGGRTGSSIKAALFLQEFVDENAKWAHIDLAGPAFDKSSGKASGYAVRTLVQWVEAHSTRASTL